MPLGIFCTVKKTVLRSNKVEKNIIEVKNFGIAFFANHCEESSLNIEKFIEKPLPQI